MTKITVKDGIYTINDVNYNDEELDAKYGDIADILRKQAKTEVDLVEFTARTEYSRPVVKLKWQVEQLQARLENEDLDAELPRFKTWSELTLAEKAPYIAQAKIRVEAGKGQRKASK